MINIYLPCVNNTENRTYSYFNIKKIENNNGNKNNNIQNGSNIIDFNELEQFSPPSYKLGMNLKKNIERNNENHLGDNEENKDNLP